MIDVMRKIMRPELYMVREVKDSTCLVYCQHCEWSGLGLHNSSFPQCSTRGMVTISETKFPDLNRVLYVHNILHDHTSLILGDLAPVLADLKLVPFLVDNILWSHQVELKSALCDQDVNVILSAPQCDLNVYVAEDDRNNHSLLLIMVVDVVLRRYLRYPPSFIPTHPDYCQVWLRNMAEELQGWF